MAGRTSHSIHSVVLHSCKSSHSALSWVSLTPTPPRSAPPTYTQLLTQRKGLNSKAGLQENVYSKSKLWRETCHRHRMSLCLFANGGFGSVPSSQHSGAAQSPSRRAIKLLSRCLHSLLKTITGNNTNKSKWLKTEGSRREQLNEQSGTVVARDYIVL